MYLFIVKIEFYIEIEKNCKPFCWLMEIDKFNNYLPAVNATFLVEGLLEWFLEIFLFYKNI